LFKTLTDEKVKKAFAEATGNANPLDAFSEGAYGFTQGFINIWVKGIEEMDCEVGESYEDILKKIKVRFSLAFKRFSTPPADVDISLPGLPKICREIEEDFTNCFNDAIFLFRKKSFSNSRTNIIFNRTIEKIKKQFPGANIEEILSEYEGLCLAYTGSEEKLPTIIRWDDFQSAVGAIIENLKPKLCFLDASEVLNRRIAEKPEIEKYKEAILRQLEREIYDSRNISNDCALNTFVDQVIADNLHPSLHAIQKDTVEDLD
jgi:hypothetical protein